MRENASTDRTRSLMRIFVGTTGALAVVDLMLVVSRLIIKQKSHTRLRVEDWLIVAALVNTYPKVRLVFFPSLISIADMFSSHLDRQCGVSTRCVLASGRLYG